MFSRALARAGLPVRFSQGFNPRPGVKFSLPRPVGVAAAEELLIVELTSEENPPEVLKRLSAQVPRGIRLLSIERLADRERRIPCEAEYALELEPASCDRVSQSVSEFLAKENVIVERMLPNRPPRRVTIRVFVQSMEVADGFLRWTQAVTQEGSARVDEILEHLGLPARPYLSRVVRCNIAYRA